MVLALANMFPGELLPAAWEDTYYGELHQARDALGALLSSERAERLHAQLETGFNEAWERAEALRAGRSVQGGAHSRVGPYREPGETLVLPAGGEDPEWEPEFKGLQHQLCALLDEQRVGELAETLAEQRRWTDLRRLRELQDASVNHDWLWALNPAHGAIAPAAEYGLAVRIRLGAHLTDEAMLCSRCGKCVLERTAAHALCCAAPEGTRGHYAVRDSLLLLAKLGDPNATTEVLELIPSNPALRPADVYTEVAFPGSRAALDVGVCSPDASGAGNDCCEAMWQRKRETYADHLEELAAQGVRYEPMVFSCYGRVHHNCAVTLERLAQQAARRQGVANHRGILRRSHWHLGVALVRRAVAMAKACQQQLREQELQLLFGGIGDGGGGEGGEEVDYSREGAVA